MSTTAFLHLLLLLLFSASTCVLAHGRGSNGEDPVSVTDLRSKSLVLVKVWCLLLVFVGTFAAGLSPYFLKWNEGFLLLGTQFAGGVFLGTAMMHFLSDSAETFRDLTEKDYPFAFMLACSGYLMTTLADCVARKVVGSRGFVEGGARKILFGITGVSQKSKSSNNDVNSQTDAQAEGATHGYMAKAAALLGSASFGESMLLIVALCFHSIFEGIAIGVAETKADAWRALWTVTLHKLFAAIAMSITLLRTIPRRPFLTCATYAFAFAISSPIGVAIGIVIDATTQGRMADWTFAISMGLACGVFLFVSINHLLSKGYRPQQPIAADSPFYRWLSVVVGVGLIAVVMIWD